MLVLNKGNNANNSDSDVKFSNTNSFKEGFENYSPYVAGSTLIVAALFVVSFLIDYRKNPVESNLQQRAFSLLMFGSLMILTLAILIIRASLKNKSKEEGHFKVHEQRLQIFGLKKEKGFLSCGEAQLDVVTILLQTENFLLEIKNHAEEIKNYMKKGGIDMDSEAERQANEEKRYAEMRETFEGIKARLAIMNESARQMTQKFRNGTEEERRQHVKEFLGMDTEGLSEGVGMITRVCGSVLGEVPDTSVQSARVNQVNLQSKELNAK